MESPRQKKEDEERGKSPDQIGDLLERLELRDEETDEIILEEDVQELRADSKWMAIGSVYSSKSFSHAALFSQMRYAWSLAKEVRFKALGENLFVLQFFCKGDWTKVMEEGPWIFRGNAFLVAEYDGVTRPSAIKFEHMSVWVRIYDLPPTFMKEKIGRQLASRIGHVLQVEVGEDGWGWGNFLRVRVCMDIKKPLIRVIPVSVRGVEGNISQSFKVKYEKLPRFCAVCGQIGHIKDECGDGMHDEANLQYGDFLLASSDMRQRWRGGPPSTISNGRSDELMSKKSGHTTEMNSTANAQFEGITNHTASLLKYNFKERNTLEDKTARKRLSVGQGDVPGADFDGLMEVGSNIHAAHMPVNGGGTVSSMKYNVEGRNHRNSCKALLLIESDKADQEKGMSLKEVVEKGEPNTRDSKRLKKNNLLESADPCEGARREQ